MDPSPALAIHFPPDTTASTRDRLVELFAELDLVAIQEDDINDPRHWTAHFASARARDTALLAVRGIPQLADARVETLDVADDDWARRTQADLPAIRVGRIIVAPPWDMPSAVAPTDIVIEIEPSVGFGTGHHQSTRLCLALLQSRDLVRRTMNDVGTGSGVLAIAAAKLGAAFVSAIDMDPESIDNARENIARNGVSAIVEAHTMDLVNATLAPADIVTANLTGTLLARHADDLVKLVKPAGFLIVSGFTNDEGLLVRSAFEARLTVSETAEEEGWQAYVLSPTPR